MSFEQRGRMPLDYQPSALPGSALRFRGPLDVDRGPAVVCIGSSATFGRFIDAPFAAQLDKRLDLPVLNLGVINAGVDVMVNDPAIAANVANAEAVVMQITGAHTLTNRFYSVHPRRNDRFLGASAMLRTIYPQVDFTEFHFIRHLLSHLQMESSDRFEIVRTELEIAWVARMRKFLNSLALPVHLLWLANRRPDAVGGTDLAQHPLFITMKMLEVVGQDAASLTIAAPLADDRHDGLDGKFFGPSEEAAARMLPGPGLHSMAAGKLLKHLSP
ncbi:DUF6473 family protein [Gymnodinialimonas sp. 57CJ19]|uniref:DUF6473 family protein n=1 Tax=Gymnodinialimonas sp. 57CJ19 TaxID=3138498 RepID=UPI0031345B3B